MALEVGVVGRSFSNVGEITKIATTWISIITDGKFLSPVQNDVQKSPR